MRQLAMCGLVLVLLLGNGSGLLAQTDSLLLHCIRQIQLEQSSGDAHFAAGLIKSYRQYDWNPKRIRYDDNIFYNGITLYTLNQLATRLPRETQPLLAQMNAANRAVAPQFKNQKGRNTYNFWNTARPEVFPNSGWINWLDKVNALPDDMDDTAMMLLALNAPKDSVAAVHRLMQQFVNNGDKRIRNTLPAYQKIPAYSTWFGQKMPVDFDFCVMTNVLLMVQQHGLPWSAADTAALAYIETVLTHEHHLTRPHIVAPHYARSPILFYHLARLMSVAPIAALEARKPVLVRQATLLYSRQTNLLDKILLRTALLRWGVNLPPENLPTIPTIDQWMRNSDFVFFIANMASMAANPWRRWIGATAVGKFYYYCPAYNYALLAEYLVLQQASENNLSAPIF